MLGTSSPQVMALWLMLAYCAAPGGVNVETARRGLRGGFASAFLVQLGAVLGRVLWASLALAGTGAFVGLALLHVVLAAFGALVLLRAAWQSLVASNAVAPSDQDGGTVRRGDFTAGLLLSLTNPVALVFWSGLVSVLGLDGGGIWDARTAPAVIAGLTVGALAWSGGAAIAIGWGRRAAGRGSLRVAEVLAGGVLGCFGLRMLWDTTVVLASIAGK